MEPCCCPVLSLVFALCVCVCVTISLIDRGLLMNLKHLIMNCQDVQEPLSQVPIFCVPSVFRWIEIAVMYKCKLARPKITRSDVVTSHNFQNSMNILQFQYFFISNLYLATSPHPTVTPASPDMDS